MLRLTLPVLMAIGLLTTEAHGVIFLFLDDEFDDGKAIAAVRDIPAVKEHGQGMDAFTDRLRPLKERDIIALFGKPVTKPAKTFAMPVAQPRGLALSGIRYADPKLNKNHTEFHAIEDFAAVEVYYAIDGVSPVAFLVYFRVDEKFPKLTRDNLDERLAWEQERLKKLTHFFEKRRAAVFVWEVDAEQEKNLSRELASGDFTVKLEAMLRWGEQRGYRLDHRPAKDEQTPRWSWCEGSNLMAEAYHDRGFKGMEGRPSSFLFYYPGGSRLRDEGGWPSLQMIRWYRPNGSLIRIEGGSARDGAWRPNDWSWYDKNGKFIRYEKDENGDGLPDISITEGGSHEKEPYPLLPLKQSWAVHPELIPEELRLPDQPKRAVPIRKIASN